MMEQRAGVEGAGIRRSFGEVIAVDHVDLAAPPGSVTALVGPNGSGKTTLLLVLASLLRPDSGTVWVANHDPVTDPQAVRALTGTPTRAGVASPARKRPSGHTVYLMIGVGALTLTIRRLRTPYGRLPHGVRVA